jgi:hypothetical protein
MRLPIVDIPKCPDKGLEALFVLNNSYLDFYEWLIILIAIEQIVTLSLIGTRVYYKFTYIVKDTLVNCKIPTGLVFWWSIFTAASVSLIGLTMRANMAVIAKTVHVIVEALFLINFYSAIKFNFATGIVAISLGFLSLWVASFSDCNLSVGVAAISGLTLDMINFFSYLLLAFTQRTNQPLWTFVHGLGWHAAYVALFTSVNMVNYPQNVSAILRMFGAVFNVISVELFIVLLKTMYLDNGLPPGWMKLTRWKEFPESTHVWEKNRVISSVKTFSAAHSSQQSAYTRGSLYKFWLGFDSTAVRTIEDKITHYFFVYKTDEYYYENVNSDQDVYVFDFTFTRIIRLVIVTILSIFLWYV